MYGDFNCPYSALASRRAATLEELGELAVDWRSVEHDPSIPLAGEMMTGHSRQGLERELSQIRELLTEGEPDALRVPPKRVNTLLVTQAFAAKPPLVRAVLREQLFATYWQDGEDLSDPAVVRRLCGEGDDPLVAAHWREEWLALPRPIVPILVMPDGYVSRGLGALDRLARFSEMAGLSHEH
jgi:hypothetical protein